MLRREIQPHPVLWHNFRFYEPWTMNDCFFSDSDAAMPRQTQADNDASGSPQRVAGRPPLLSVLATVLHLPMVGTWWSERLWDGPYGCGYAATDSSRQRRFGKPSARSGPPAAAVRSGNGLASPDGRYLVVRKALGRPLRMRLCRDRLKPTTTLREALSA